MDERDLSAALLAGEARSVLARLDQLRPLALHETMVPAAALPATASLAIERFLHTGRTMLRGQVQRYIAWLAGPGRAVPASEQQAQFVRIRMRFNAILSQFDMFSDVVTQRSEHQTGVWLAGLDVFASDALSVVRHITDPPPVVCYLSRGAGAAIRRARTRMPGGDASPVAIIRIPRERMVGQGIAASLTHEVGHQGAALLGLVDSVRHDVAAARLRVGQDDPVWASWERWISEILADLWAIATLGLSATVGLLAVVSLPRYFVFRPSGEDPHPIPYVRVLLSCALGQALYPHPQWAAMARAWKAMYPVAELPEERRVAFAAMEEQIEPFVDLLLGHRSAGLGGATLGSEFPTHERTPAQLVRLHRQWGGDVPTMARQAPSLVFAVLGHARISGRLTPEAESRLLSSLLQVWALRSSLTTSERLTQAIPLRRVS